MTTVNKFFATKEQYLAFRAAFAAAQHDVRAKKTFTDGVAEVWNVQSNNYSHVATKIKHYGWLTAAHFMVLNLARGLPKTRGFTPITSKVKLENGMLATCHIDSAENALAYQINAAKKFVQNHPAELNSWEMPSKVSPLDMAKAKAEAIEKKTVSRNKQLKVQLDAFLEPFAGTFTIGDLSRLGE